MRRSIANKAPAALVLLALVLAWQAASAIIGSALILPGPLAALGVLGRLAASGDTWIDLGATLLRGLAGFSLSYLAGSTVGIAGGLYRPFDAAVRPLLAGIRSTPTMALILLALIWFKSDQVAVFVVFLVVFPIVAQNAAEGIRAIDPSLIEMARVYQVGRARLLRELYLPAILPYLAAGAAAGLGLTWKVMISAEVLAGPRRGIGVRMDTARIFLQTPEVFAWTAVVVLVGLVFDYALNGLIQRKMLYW